MTSPQFVGEVGHLPNTSWIYNNFGFVMLGVFFITGIIIFAKLRSNR